MVRLGPLTGALAVFLLSSTPALARDITGIYVFTAPSGVTYLNITDVNGTLTGFSQSVVADVRAPGGVKRDAANFTGSVSGSHMVLIINAAVRPPGVQWTGELTWSGFTIAIPQANGQIGEYAFRRSSISEVNSLIARLSQNGAQVKANVDQAQAAANAAAAQARYRQNVSLQIEAARREIQNNLEHRPRILSLIVAAKSKVDKAARNMDAATAELSRREEIAKQARGDADAARAAATTVDENVRASQMSANASGKSADVSAARANLTFAQVGLASANQDLRGLQSELQRLDAHVADLRALIVHDQQILAQH